MPTKPQKAKPRSSVKPLKRQKPPRAVQMERQQAKLAKKPIMAKAFDQAVQIMAADDTIPAVTEKNAEDIAAGLTKIMPTIPAFQQAANLEPFLRSRILNGAAVGVAGLALPYLLPQHTLTFLLPLLGWDISPEELNAIAGELITAAGIVIVIVGRAFTFSKPAWSRLAGWISRLRGKPAVAA